MDRSSENVWTVGWHLIPSLNLRDEYFQIFTLALTRAPSGYSPDVFWWLIGPDKLSFAASLGQDQLLRFGRSLEVARTWEVLTLIQARISICKAYISAVVLVATGATSSAVASCSWSLVVSGEAGSSWAASPSFPLMQIEGVLVFDKRLSVPSLPLREERQGLA